MANSISEDSLHNKLYLDLNNWSHTKSGQLQYKLYHLTFPKGEKEDEWMNLFRPCASQRLFLPSVLPRIDSVVYMDTDCLVLRPVEDIWQHFSHFDSRQLAAMAPNSEVESVAWYNKFSGHPFYGKFGINSGVMLMNLTRMRQFRWNEKIPPIYRQYKLEITLGDQDILNILFHNHSAAREGQEDEHLKGGSSCRIDLLYVVPCNWNFRPKHCMYGSNCRAAEMNGISVIHGNNQAFHSVKQPFFKAIYDTVTQYKLKDPTIHFAYKLQTNLSPFKKTHCGKLTEKVLKFPRQYSNTP